MKKIALGFSIILAFMPLTTLALTSDQEAVISGECDTIRETLKMIQRADSKVRTHLGAYYENILNKFMKPLNNRLVETNIPSNELINAQVNLKNAKDKFSEDFILYQRILGDELIQIDCRNNPKGFYDKLVEVRQARAIVRDDVQKTNALIYEYRNSVTRMMEGLND